MEQEEEYDYYDDEGEAESEDESGDASEEASENEDAEATPANNEAAANSDESIAVESVESGPESINRDHQENPNNFLEPHEMQNKEYRYQTFRLTDCNILSVGKRKGLEKFTMVEYDSKLWTFGGIDHRNQYVSTVLVYDIQESLWQTGLHRVEPPARICHTAVCYRDSMFVFGGGNGRRSFNDLWQYNFTYEHWIHWLYNKSLPHPDERMCHGAAIRGSKMIIFGGAHHMRSRSRRRSDLQNMWSVDLNINPFAQTPRWNKIPFIGRIPKYCGGVSTTVDDEIFVWEKYTALLSCFNFQDQEWTRVMYDEELKGHLLVSKKKFICSYGGVMNGTQDNELKVWDIDGDEEGYMPRFYVCDNEGDVYPPGRRDGAGAVVGDSIYVFGGRNDDRRLNDLWVIKTWEVDNEGAPVLT